MLKSMEFRGKTTEDAISNALKELHLERDDISVEILDSGKTGFFGLGAVEAVVRVSFEAPDEPAPAKEAAEKPVPAQPRQKKAEPAERREEAPKAEAPRRDAAPKSAPKKEATPAAPTAETSAAAQAESVSEKKPVRAEGTQAEQTEKFLSGLLEHMGVRAEIEISPRKGGGLDVNLSGSGIGAVIGRRGETLDAIQHLTNYAVNRGSDKRSHINVDAENYRAKREESLVRLAEKMASKAIKYKRSMALEPMNSYERHVIHAALQDFEGVTTSSTGTEPNRRVVVSYVPAEKKAASDYKEWC